MGRSRKRPFRKDWESVKDRIKCEAVLAKFTQHADLRETLLATGDSKIVEHTENDSHWGDGSGKNRLGQILMRVRE
jgi:N-glycosidase YbiA